MDKQKFNLILDKLLERTEKGNLEWKTTADRDTFLVILKDDSISINYSFGREPDFDGIINNGFYTFDFRNENGDITNSVEVVNTSATDKEFKEAARIFELARAQAFKSDPTADRILEQLAA